MNSRQRGLDFGRSSRLNLSAGPGGGPADDQVRGDDGLPAGPVRAVQAGQGADDGQVGQAGDVLADAGEVDVGQPGQVTVVEADHGDLARDGDASAEEHVQHAGGALVVEGQNGGRPGLGGQQGAGGRGAVLLAQAAGQDPGAQAVAAHGGAVAAPPVGAAGGPAAVDVNDVAVAEADQMVHGQASSVIVRGPHHLDPGRGRRQPPGDADDRQLGG